MDEQKFDQFLKNNISFFSIIDYLYDLLKDNHVIQLGIFPTERSLLHKRIDKRLKELLNDGLIEETKKILDTYKIKQIRFYII